jgi:hypothetical protein
MKEETLIRRDIVMTEAGIYEAEFELADLRLRLAKCSGLRGPGLSKVRAERRAALARMHRHGEKVRALRK